MSNSCDDTKNIVCSKPDHVMYDISVALIVNASKLCKNVVEKCFTETLYFCRIVQEYYPPLRVYELHRLELHWARNVLLNARVRIQSVVYLGTFGNR